MQLEIFLLTLAKLPWCYRTNPLELLHAIAWLQDGREHPRPSYVLENTRKELAKGLINQHEEAEQQREVQ